MPLVTASLLLGTASPAGAQAAADSAERVERGGALYRSHCLRCHGASGDDSGYPGIVPLAGIDRRLAGEEIAELSAPFVGRVFEGDDARALVAYLATLGGAKGFAEPGFLFSPYLLDKKRNDVHGYRIVDVRPQAAYDESHVVNAVPWPEAAGAGSPGGEPGALAPALAGLGIGPETCVVVYDEQGGPDAASLWWRLLRAGHERAAVLDGGWTAWREAGYAVSSTRPRIEAAAYDGAPAHVTPHDAPAAETPVLRLGTPPEDSPFGEPSIWFDSRATRGEGGLREAAEIARHLEGAGMALPGQYRVADPGPELGYLVLLLHLTGREATYHVGSRVLSVR